MAHTYSKEYAQHYIKDTLSSPYTEYKNISIATVCQSLRVKRVSDLGGNVSGIVNVPGSLRHQLGLLNIDYFSIDLVFAYFNPDLARQLGLDTSSVYPTVNGIVGDIQKLPIAPNSLEAVVSADVIEHVPNPHQALSEIYRVLKPSGSAVVVVPSLYKLDGLQLGYIDAKRYSSHENKLTTPEWMNLFKASGLSINLEKTRPLGILSGLLYTAWLDERFVPSKESQDDDEIFSKEARLFKAVKNIVSQHDHFFDEQLLSNPQALDDLTKFITDENIHGLLCLIKKIIEGRITSEEDSTFSKFINTFSNDNVNGRALQKLRSVVCDHNNLFIGNSILFVLSKGD